MKVLVVDDSPDAAEPLIAYLHLRGDQTCLAHNASDALQLAATFQPDLALLDIGMPGMDGWVLGTLLRGLPGLADLPIIAVTGYSLAAHRQKSADANFQHHLVKPIDYTALDALMKGLAPESDALTLPSPAAPPEVKGPAVTPVSLPPANPEAGDS